MTAMKWFMFIMLLMVFLSGCDNAAQNPERMLPENTEQVPAATTQTAGDVPKCPASCDDYDNCTEDHCSDNTDFKCTHDAIVPCCGNSICEKSEDHDSCKTDCQECIAGKCESASFDYDTGQCVISPVVPCCGNSICEENETFENCKDDCPDCTTDEKCKTALFDYSTHQCKTRPLVPCCGNDICDIGESCTSCSQDCKCKESVDLVKYPDFLQDGTLLVVGDKGTSQDVITATGMITDLAADGVKAESDVLSMIDQSKIDSKDMIVLGGPCDNKLWQDYMNVDCDANYIKADRAIIKLVIQNNREILFIAGHMPLDTKKAAEALTGGRISFKSTEVELDTSGSIAKII